MAGRGGRSDGRALRLRRPRSLPPVDDADDEDMGEVIAAVAMGDDEALAKFCAFTLDVDAVEPDMDLEGFLLPPPAPFNDSPSISGSPRTPSS